MALEAKVKQDAPKVDYFDGLVDRNLLTNLRTTAKQLNIPQKQFTAHLLTDDLFTVKEACNMWSTFKSFICEQLICDQLKRNQYQECDMGISYSQFVIYRTQLKNARFGVQAASVILHYKAKVAKQSSLNP